MLVLTHSQGALKLLFWSLRFDTCTLATVKKKTSGKPKKIKAFLPKLGEIIGMSDERLFLVGGHGECQGSPLGLAWV